MKSNSTTEERAEAHLNGRKPIIEIFASHEKLSNDAKRSILFHCFKDYYDGAKEQSVIDDAELTEIKRERDAYYDELLSKRQRIAELEAKEKALRGWIAKQSIYYDDMYEACLNDLTEFLDNYGKEE